jgi:hypothetical protein
VPHISPEVALPTFLALLVSIGVLLRLLRARARELAELRRAYERASKARDWEDETRRQYCNELGHDLDARCRCRRCLVTHHDGEEVGVEQTWVEDDPGALYLDSNFQPDGHYETSRRYRCRRCGAEY